MIKFISPENKSGKNIHYSRTALVTLAFIILNVIVSPAYSQNTSLLTLDMNNQTVGAVLRAIEQQSGFVFLYNDEMLDASRTVTINVRNQSVDKVLDELLRGTNNSYVISDRQIYITEKPAPARQEPAPAAGRGGDIVLDGMVISSTDHKPIPGVAVYVENQPYGTVTALDGTYKLTVPADTRYVTFSYLGYDTKTLQVAESFLFKLVTMIEQVNKLEDIVVVGFGTQKKESLVAAIESIKPSDLDITSSNLSTSFMGKIAGLTGFQKSGEPGNDDVTFYIRGLSTFGYNTGPLIVLDGVEILPAMLNNIPPESIESFSILKDATSTSLYGSRGANGVIIVNTKEGRDSEKMSINFGFENTFSMPTRVQKIADGVTYMENYNEAYGDFFYTQDQIDGTRNKLNPYVYPDNDWYKQLFKDFTVNQTFNFNMSGGARKIDYFLNATIANENGIIREPKEVNFDTNVSSRKFIFQSNVSSMVTKTTRVGLKMNSQLWYNNSPYESINNLFFYTMRANPVRFAPVLPAEEGDTYTRYGNNNSWDVGATDLNPYAELSKGYTKRYRSYLTTAINVNQDLGFVTPGLSVKGMASFYNYTSSSSSGFFTPYYYKVVDPTVDASGNYVFDQQLLGDPGSTFLSYSTAMAGHREWSLQASVDYSRTFGRHDVGGMLVYHSKERVNNLGNNTTADEYQVLPFRELGYAGRFTYSYDRRYFVELAFGYNGSENFAKGHRFGFFPSAAVGYTISNEKFFAPLRKVVSNLKVRASYGITGNDALSLRFPYLSEVTMNQSISFNKGSAFSSTSGPLISTYGNANATWEEGKIFDIGLDIGLFNSLNITFDYYTENRTGIFMQRESLPTHLGTAKALPMANIGRVVSNGVDLTADYSKVINPDLRVSMRGTFTYAHNEVKNIDEASGLPDYFTQVGRPISSIRGYVADKLFATQAEIDSHPTYMLGETPRPGDIKYLDLNDDKVIDGNDITTIGYPTIPEIVYGIGAGVNYKKWDFSFFFQGTARVSINMYDMHAFADEEHFGYNMTKWIADSHWSESNPDINADYPRLNTQWSVNNTLSSSFWVRNGSYFRLKNVEVGYKATNFMRVYVAGTNLFTISPFKFWDPEMGSGNGLGYPLQRTFKLGVKFNF